MYYYDQYGWLTSQPLAGRSTDVLPPTETTTLKANWTGLAWTLVEYTEPPALEPTIVTTPKHISVGAFFDRFGALKYPILASTDASVKAVILDASVRSYIDLDNPELPMGLAILTAAGFAVDSAVVIDAPVLDTERP